MKFTLSWLRDHLDTTASVQEIADKLFISPKTVELHRSRVMAKMQADSVVHLTRMALSQRAE